MNKNNKKSNFIKNLERKATEPHFQAATYDYYKKPESYKEPKHLLNILELNAESVSETANEIITFLEENNDNPKNEYIDFKWKLTAFLNLCDIFDAIVYESKYVNNIFCNFSINTGRNYII